MAQVLKEELKVAILNSAKEEILTNGYENASMRNIAKASNMTVGNLYRYFKSKEEISRAIVKDTYNEILTVLNTLSLNSIAQEARVFDTIASVKELCELMDKFSNKITDIFSRNMVEFRILILHTKLSKDLIDWFNEIIIKVIKQSVDNNEIDIKLLAEIYSTSIYSGLRSIFTNKSLDIKVVEYNCSTFLKSYVYMLHDDLKEVV